MNLTRSILKPTVLMLILLLLSPHSTSVVQSTSELNQDIVSHSTDGNISSIQHNTLTWNSINLMNEVIYSDSNVVMYLSDWTDNGGISFTDQFGTREYSVISMSGFYANCGSLTTNPTSYYHGLPNEGSDGFLYYSVNSHILQLKEENQFSTNIITISEEGISFTQELKGSANLDSSSPIYNGEWVLESNVANLQPTQLIRLGLFIDQTVSMVDLQALCLEMFNAHAVLISTFDVTVQIEFIKTIQKQDTATVAGYGQVDASLCENDELKDYLRTNAYELMENGRMLSSIQSTTDYTRYNRGKYLDHIVYYSDDSYWDWKKVDQDGNEYSIRGCADWGDADHMPSVVRMHDDDGDSWTYHTYLHEMGHTFGIRHDTGTCTEPRRSSQAVFIVNWDHTDNYIPACDNGFNYDVEFEFILENPNDSGRSQTVSRTVIDDKNGGFCTSPSPPEPAVTDPELQIVIQPPSTTISQEYFRSYGSVMLNVHEQNAYYDQNGQGIGWQVVDSRHDQAFGPSCTVYGSCYQLIIINWV